MLLHLSGQNILHWQQELSGKDILHNYLFFVMQGKNHYKVPLHSVHYFGGSGDAGYWCVRTPSVELLQGNNVSL